MPSPSTTAKQTMTVSVVSHGQRSLAAALLAQLAGLGNPAIARVVLTHNLPDADLPKPAGANFELVQLHNPKPLGFATNHNRAFRHCATAWFAVLNPDLDFRFGDPFLTLMDAATATPDIGVLAPQLIDPTSQRPELPRGLVTPWEIARRRLPGWRPPAKHAWLVGAFLLLRAEAYRDVAGFDERYRLYCEDIDLSLRLQLRGWRAIVCPDALVLHSKQYTSHKSLRYTYWHIASLSKFWASPTFWRFRAAPCHCTASTARSNHAPSALPKQRDGSC